MRVLPPEPDAVRALELPRLVRLGENLYAACFSLMKLLPARFIVDRAIAEGRLDPGTTIVETTSGTFGLGLAMVGALRRRRVVLVSDPVVDDDLRRRLADLGAGVDIVRDPAPVGGYQRARLDRLAELCDRYAPAFVPGQYDNPLNPASYAAVAELLLERLGEVDVLVGAVGSGGSMCGTARFLRAACPHLTAVGVDTHGSVLFGMPDRHRLLRGLGNSLLPPNLDHTVFDDVHWVGAAGAFAATRRLHAEHALFMGPTSGAAWLAARWVAAREPGATVVVLMADEGHRYQRTVGNDEWLRAHGVRRAAPPGEPVRTTSPHDTGGEWDWMHWGRRPAPPLVLPELAGVAR